MMSPPLDPRLDRATAPSPSVSPATPAIGNADHLVRPAGVTSLPPPAAPPAPRAGWQAGHAWILKQLVGGSCAPSRDEPRTDEAWPARRFGFNAIGRREPGRSVSDARIEKLEASHEKLEASLEDLRHHVRNLEASGAPQAKPKRQRRGRRYGGRGVKKDNDYWLQRLERDVARELKDEGCQPKEFDDQMRERVYGLSSERAAEAINNRYRAENGGKDVVSASSIRRRDKSGGYQNKTWADWKVRRTAKHPDGGLAPGSMKMPLPDDGDAGGSPDADRSAATATKGSAAQEDEDDRQRSLFDGGLATATWKDAAEEAIAKGALSRHEGGRGVARLRPPKNALEAHEDRQEQAADALLRQEGLDPHAVHLPCKERRRTTADNG